MTAFWAAFSTLGVVGIWFGMDGLISDLRCDHPDHKHHVAAYTTVVILLVLCTAFVVYMGMRS